MKSAGLIVESRRFGLQSGLLCLMVLTGCAATHISNVLPGRIVISLDGKFSAELLSAASPGQNRVKVAPIGGHSNGRVVVHGNACDTFAVGISDKGRYLATGGSDNCVRVWPLGYSIDTLAAYWAAGMAIMRALQSGCKAAGNRDGHALYVVRLRLCL